MSLSVALAVFAACALSDVAIGLYVRRAAEGKAFQAALFGCAPAFTALVSIMAYISDPRYSLVAAAGYFFGTYVVVKFDQRRSTKIVDKPEGV